MSNKTVEEAENGKDYFALLGLPRHPWVDPATLKNQYHAAASRAHPDHASGSAGHFLLLGEAVSNLKDPTSRLQHLLALEFGAGQAKARFNPPVELFQTVSAALRKGDAAALQLKIAHTPLGQAAALGAVQTATAELKSALDLVGEKLGQVEICCREAGGDWRERGADFWAQLAAESRYLEKWQRQLEDLIFRLNHTLPRRSSHNS